MAVVAEGGEIDAELVGVAELDAEDHRLDGDLPRLDIDLGEDLVELGEDRGVVADDDHVGAGEAVAAGFVLVGGNVDLGRRLLTVILPIGRREQRREERLQVGGLDVVGAIDAGVDAVLRLVHQGQVGGRADVDDVAFAARRRSRSISGSRPAPFRHRRR